MVQQGTSAPGIQRNERIGGQRKWDSFLLYRLDLACFDKYHVGEAEVFPLSAGMRGNFNSARADLFPVDHIGVFPEPGQLQIRFLPI